MLASSNSPMEVKSAGIKTASEDLSKFPADDTSWEIVCKDIKRIALSLCTIPSSNKIGKIA